MAYELINKEFNIWSCSIADLSMEQVRSLSDQYGPGTKIGNLYMFKEEYEPGNWRLVLNRDRENYDTISRFVTHYLKVSIEERTKLREKITVHREMFNIMACYLEERENTEILNMLKHQGEAIPDDYYMTYSLVRKLGEEEKFLGMMKAFEYGFIQGKRCERGRRKAGVSV